VNFPTHIGRVGGIDRLPGTSPSNVRPAVYLLTTIFVAIIATVFAEPTLYIRNTAVLVPTSCLCIGVCLWHVFRSLSVGVLRLVFVFLAIHAVVGYLVAESSAPAIVSGTLDNRTFALSFLVIASGLMVASFAFHLSPPANGWLPHVDVKKLVKIAKWMTVGAALTMFYFYNKNEMLPWQVDILEMGKLRYQIAGLDEWLINRSTDVLVITVPLLFLFKRAEKLLSLVGLLALAITFKRAPILAVILVAVLSSVIRTGKLKKLVLAVTVAGAVYVASQVFYLGMLQGNDAPEDLYLPMASGLPEVRDLGWIIWLNKGELHWGTTLIQPFLPIPSFISPWIQEHGLRGITTQMTGYDRDEMGGLRITLAGEGYLNFGAAGTIVLCSLWGWGMRKINNVVVAANQSGSVVDAYFAALLISWIAFWLYLGGSQASGVIKSAVILVAAMLYISRTVNVRTSLTAEMAS
jgi:hypothetical protein